MSANVRRLALDINPWVWVYVAFILCVTLFSDTIWFRGHESVRPLMPGFLLYIGAAFAAQKVPLWRTLPVTRAQIDRARWWQGVAAPALLLCSMCLGTAFVMGGLGLRRAMWPDIGTLALAQSATSILLSGVAAVVFPFAAEKFGRWSTLLLVPLMLVIFRFQVPGETQIDLRPLLLAMGAVGLATAAALYTLAGHWPAPLTTALWAVPPKDRALPKQAAIKPQGLSGWPIWVLGNLPTFALLWVLTACVPLMMKWSKMDLSTFGWITCFVALHFSVYSIVTAIRTLRTLPFSGWQLTCRLTLLLVLVQAISLAIFEAGLLMTGGRVFSPAIFLMPLAYSLVYFPFGLRFGLRVLQFGLGFQFIVILPVQILAEQSGAVPWVIIGSLAVMAVGFTWTYWEIARGHRAYRVQPLVPLTWRGIK